MGTTQPSLQPPPRGPEEELDSLIAVLKEREQEVTRDTGKPDPIAKLREMTIREFVPVFVELAEKYQQAGFSMQMDASNFLQGGREITFEFGLGEHRMQLMGTVTTEAIAFHETRYSPDVAGELVSGPMLRLRRLDGQAFRNFVCQRLTLLVRSVGRRR